VNFLAHLYLARPGGIAPPGVLVGALLPDIWRGRLPPLGPDLDRGVSNHRQVDRFTDRHAAFLRSRSRLRDRHGVFAGVLVDMAYDHLLARQWEHWHATPLPNFIAAAHDAVAQHEAQLPPVVASVARRMREGDWLTMYRDVEPLRAVLAMMSRRFTQRFDRPVDLTRAVETISEHRAGLESDFSAFFPEIIRYVQQPPPRADARTRTRRQDTEQGP
jgi:acyl carrier protein phosphodiesterase